MSHRRSSSLSGGTRVAELQPEPPPPSSSLQSYSYQEGHKAPPRKALSVDTGSGVEVEEYYSGRRGTGRLEFASHALSTIGNKSEEIIQRFDEKCDYIENGPIAQSAKATAHKAAEVIEEKVLKHVRLPDEVYEVLHEIEKTQAYQTAKCGVHRAYSYVEPIISRVNSQEVEDDQVDFVIPPNLENQFLKGTDSPSISRPYNRSFELDIQQYQVYEPRESVPEIKISDETGRSSIITLNSESLLKEKAPDTFSLASAADSEFQYEVIRPNKLYKTPPLPKPFPKKRRSFKSKTNNNIGSDVMTLFRRDNEKDSDTQKLLRSSTEQDSECTDEIVSKQPTKKSTTGKGKKLQRQETINEGLGGAKLTRTSNFEISDGSREDEPLVPKKTKIKGIPEEELRERLKDKLDSVICINGKTYIIHKSSEQDNKPKEKYGGASEFFEESSDFAWEAVTGILPLSLDPYSSPLLQIFRFKHVKIFAQPSLSILLL